MEGAVKMKTLELINIRNRNTCFTFNYYQISQLAPHSTSMLIVADEVVS